MDPRLRNPRTYPDPLLTLLGPDELGSHSIPMETQMNLKDLKKPFGYQDLEFKIQSSGEKQDGSIWARCVTYISARAIQDRLDEVCGPENWKVEYDILPTGVLCKLSIKIENEWISKIDGAEPSQYEPFKGGISNALKRAGSCWGIGRYLYNLESSFALIVEKSAPGSQWAETKNKKTYYWLPPQLPLWALPEPLKKESVTPTPEPEFKEPTIQEKEKEELRVDNCRIFYKQLKEIVENRIASRQFCIGYLKKNFKTADVSTLTLPELVQCQSWAREVKANPPIKIKAEFGIIPGETF